MAGGAMLGLLYDAIDNVDSFLHVFVYVYSLLILALHHHVVGPAAVLGLAEPDPAIPLRRLRSVSAPLAPHPAVVRAARPLARRRRWRSSTSLCGIDHEHPRTAALKGETHDTHPGRDQTSEAVADASSAATTATRSTGCSTRSSTSFEDVWRERADLADKVEQLEDDLVRYRELEGLLRTTLVSAEKAAVSSRSRRARRPS